MAFRGAVKGPMNTPEVLGLTAPGREEDRMYKRRPSAEGDGASKASAESAAAGFGLQIVPRLLPPDAGISPRQRS